MNISAHAMQRVEQTNAAMAAFASYYNNELENGEEWEDLPTHAFHDLEELHEMRWKKGYDPEACRVIGANDNTGVSVEHATRNRRNEPTDYTDMPEGSVLSTIPVYNGKLEELGKNLAWSFDISTGRNQEDRNWKTQSVSFLQFLERLFEHKQAKKKNGACFMQGSIVPGVKQRSLANVEALSFMVLDIDSGQPMEELRRELINQDLFAVLYTTWSNGATQTQLKKQDVLQKLKLDQGDEITTGMIKHYLQHYKRFDKRVVDACVYEGEKHVEGGVMCFVSHAPMPKYRIVLPLMEDFVIAKVAHGNERAAREMWKQKYTGLAHKLGASYDRSCTDISRLFFWPTHPAEAKSEPRAEVVIGDFLDLSKIEGKDAKELENSNPFIEAGGDSGDEVPMETPWLKNWMRGKYVHFQAADFFEWASEENVRNRNGEKVTVKCPHDDGHGNAGDSNDRGFFCVNGDSDEKSFVARCSHHSCQQYRNLNFVDKMIQDFNLTGEDLDQFIPEYVEESSSHSIGVAATLPQGFMTGKDANEGYIGYIKQDGDKSKFVRVCSVFEVRGEARTEGGDGWSLVIQFADREGRVKQERISRGDLAADSKIIRRTLADAGLWVATSEYQKFDALLNELRSDQLILFARMPGWQAGGFVTPDGRMIGDKEGATVMLENARSNSIRGTLEESVAVMNAVLRSGVAHWQIAPMIAVAGCLISFSMLDSCGIALTGASSKGKTTALRIAASAWGDPEGKGRQAVVASLSGTANSFEGIAQRGNGTVVLIDELQHLDDGRDVQQLLYTLAQGEGRGRLRPDGTERERRNWRSFYALTGEVGVLQKIETGGGKVAGGVNARVVDLDVSNERDVDQTVLDALSGRNEHFGHYGPAFAEWLAENGNPDELRTKVRAYASEIAGVGAVPLEKRNALIFGLLRVSGELLQEANLLDQDTNVAALITRLKRDNTPDGVKPIDRALQKLRENVNECWNSSIHPVVPSEDDPAYGKANAWRDGGLSGGRVFIPKERLAVLAGGMVKPRELVAALKALEKPAHRGDGWDGVLQVKGKNDNHPQIPENGVMVAHYRIDASFFRGDGMTD